MPIVAQCTSCSVRINAPDTAAGKLVSCPKCHARVLIPQLKTSGTAEDVTVDDPTGECVGPIIPTSEERKRNWNPQILSEYWATRIFLIIAAVGLFVAVWNGCAKTPDGNKPSVQVVTVRLEPFRTAGGDDTKIVYIDLKNTGNRPVRIVSAKIRGFDWNDQEIEVIPVPDYCIYARFNNHLGIKPGETYIKPFGEGFILPPLLPRMPTRVTVEITRVEEKGM